MKRFGTKTEARPRVIRLLAFFALLTLLGGCTLIGSSAGPGQQGGPSEMTGPVPQGAFQGFLEIEGGRLNGTLTLTPTGQELEAYLEAPPDLVAMGRGQFKNDELRLNLSYQGACPGRMTLIGRWEEGPGTLSGVVRADDCTGRADGTFLFSPDLNSFFPVGN